MLSDIRDIYPYEIYVLAIILAHANSSMNSILYGVTNTQFRMGYKLLLSKLTCGYLYTQETDFMEHTSKVNDGLQGTASTALPMSPAAQHEGNSSSLIPTVT